ncbi:hypothetical protein C8J56DRAFT_1168242 [Mycena floridula]|nr:hypothetical protein C8J56DRAFT_1168242 [Mycena floridula]
MRLAWASILTFLFINAAMVHAMPASTKSTSSKSSDKIAVQPQPLTGKTNQTKCEDACTKDPYNHTRGTPLWEQCVRNCVKDYEPTPPPSPPGGWGNWPPGRHRGATQGRRRPGAVHGLT